MAIGFQPQWPDINPIDYIKEKWLGIGNDPQKYGGKGSPVSALRIGSPPKRYATNQLKKTAAPIPTPAATSVAEPQQDDLFRDMIAQLMADRENSRDQSVSNMNSWATQDLSGVGKPYDVQIGALDDLGDRARRDTKQNSGDVQALYAALTRSIDDRNAGLQGDFQRTTDSMVNLGQGNADSQAAYAQNLLNRNAQSSTILDPGQQEKLLAELNGPVTQAAQVGGNNALSLANQYAQRNTAQKGSANQFFNHLATGSTIEGTNRAADMMQKLQDYLVDIQNQQAGLGADKANAISGARGDLLSGLAKSSTDANNYYMQNGLDIAKMVMGNAQNEAENNLAFTKLQSGGNNGRDSEAKLLSYAQAIKYFVDMGMDEVEARDYAKILIQG